MKQQKKKIVQKALKSCKEKNFNFQEHVGLSHEKKCLNLYNFRE